MAGDWIKMRTNLDSDPRVIEIATVLKTSELHVVGMLWKVWAWADSHTLGGNAIRVTGVTLDRFTCCTGFADALRNVGWLDGRDNAITFPRFAEHNGQTAKKRAETNERVRKHRNANTVTDVTRKALPEKRREEKSLTLSLSGERLKELEPHEAWATEWQSWLNTWEGRMGKRFDPTQAQFQLGDLLAADPDKAKRDLAFSLKKYAKSILDSDDDYSKRSRSSSGKKKSELRI